MDYKTLGLQQGASTDDIKTAYKNLAKIHHPDKGGDPERFKEINNAFDRLSNPNKKNETHHHDPFENVARQFFGGSFPFFHGGQPPHRGMFKQMVDVHMNLEDIYQAKRLHVNNQEVYIPANTPIHKEIPVPGTNIVILIRHNKHPVFDVESHTYNLVYKQNISLCEALLGFQCKLKHPNGEMLFIKSPPNKVIQNNMVLTAKGKGIPTIRGPLSNLIVMFEVEIPSSFDSEKYGSVLKEMFGWDVPEIKQTPGDVLTLIV
jgi:DnaJ-class molecular chaperone